MLPGVLAVAFFRGNEGAPLKKAKAKTSGNILFSCLLSFADNNLSNFTRLSVKKF